MNRRAKHPSRFGGYVYPFRRATPGRVDMGKDFTGKGPIRAVGKAKILSTQPPPGWPEGGGVLYQLLEGPRAGTIIYNYEGVDVRKGLRAGDIVNAGEQIASFRPGGSIEWGFADARGETLAHDRGELAAGNSNLRAGREAQRFLGQLQHPRAKKESPYASLAKGLGISPAEAKKLAESENLGEGPLPSLEEAGDAAGGLAGAVISGILGDIHPEALMLNIGLVGGGAFLVYYGAALMLGVKKPVATPIQKTAGAAAVAPK